jgi:5-hydroxyisourate hydrolase-like protein (transthyretin family)
MTTFRGFVYVLFLAVVTASVSIAQAPPAPANLTVQIAPNAVGALLQWEASPGAHGYKVFRAVDSSVHFQRIATVQALSFVDHLVGRGHVYHYHVRAFNSAGESGPSNMVSFSLPPPVLGTIAGMVVDDSTNLPVTGVRIAFYRTIQPNTMPVRVAFTDSLGSYSTELDTGRYLLYASKHGYRAEWYDDSPQPGSATPVVVSEGTTVTANFGLSVFTPQPPHIQGTIAGLILDDSTGLPIGGVRIRFYRGNGHVFPREARTDSLGMYSADLDTGRYLVYATKFGYRPEWYDNAPNRQNATPVVVSQNAMSVANFGLAPLAPPHSVSVSGTVNDSVSGVPIAGAFVLIARTHEGLRTIGDLNGIPGGLPSEIYDGPNGRIHGVVWSGRTDQDGNYAATVRADFTYIAAASSPGYFREWYLDKSTPIEADRLLLTTDTTGINFDLVQNPLLQNSIAGVVKDSSGVFVPAHVVLFVATNNGPRPVFHVSTDSLGNYVFRFIRPELYYLRAFPAVDYAPAWYRAGAYGVMDWHDADTVRANGDVTGIDIGVVPTSAGGFASIGGRILDNVSASVAGAVVYAVPLGSNRPADYDISRVDGSFSLRSLAPATYRIFVDKEGYGPVGISEFALHAGNDYQVTNATVRVTPASPTSVQKTDPSMPFAFRLEQNFPNPFNPTTEIRFSVPVESQVSLTVYNLLGQPVAELFDGTLGVGSYVTHWDATDKLGRNVSSGIYFFKMVSMPAAGGPPFEQVRKMLLMK